jgi:hypothetical protein
LLGLFGGLVSIPAPIIGGAIWEAVGSHYLILLPAAISILVKIIVLTTIPEKRKGSVSET